MPRFCFTLFTVIGLLLGTSEAGATPILFGDVVSTTIGFGFGTALAGEAIGSALADAESSDGAVSTSTFTDLETSDDGLDALAYAEASSDAINSSIDSSISGTSQANLSFTNTTTDLLAITLVAASVFLDIGVTENVDSPLAEVGGVGFLSVSCPGCMFFDESGPILDFEGDAIQALFDSDTAFVRGSGRDGFELAIPPHFAVLGPGHTIDATAGASFRGSAVSTPEPSPAFLVILGLGIVGGFARRREPRLSAIQNDRKAD